MPGPQEQAVAIDIGALEVSPASGNQDEEYIELLNRNAEAVDISGWRLTGAVEHTFLPGTIIRGNGAMYVSPEVRVFRSRGASPRGGEGPAKPSRRAVCAWQIRAFEKPFHPS